MDEEEEKEDKQERGDSENSPVVEGEDPPPSNREEPPPPIGPMLDKSKILEETLSIISRNLKQIHDQKHYLATMAFMAHSIQGMLDRFREHVDRTNSFLVNDEQLQCRWFLQFHNLLPPYGDYALVLKNVPDKVLVDEVPVPVEESVLKELVDDVVHNLFAGGLQVKAQRTMDTKSNAKMDERREFSKCDAFPFHTWLMMLGKEIGNEEMLEDHLFEISSFLDFLNFSGSE